MERSRWTTKRIRRRAGRRRRHLRHRRRLSPADALPRSHLRHPRGARARSAAPGTCSATPASAPTPTCTRSATRSGRGPNAKAIADGAVDPRATCATRRASTASTATSASATAWSRAAGRRATRAGRSRCERGDGGAESRIHLQLPLHVQRLLRLRRRATRPSSPASERFAGRDRPPAAVARGPRLRRQARRRHRQRRHRRHAGARAGEDRRRTSTMLQRSPTYIVSLPGEDPHREQAAPAPAAAHSPTASRAGRTCCSACAFFRFCRRNPERARALHHAVASGTQLGPDADVATHFTPRYNPWEQRLCLVPDGDLFRADARGPRVGRHRPDRDVHRDRHQAALGRRARRPTSSSRATGLNLAMLGGARAPRRRRGASSAASTVNYKGMMFSDVPNLAHAFGYTNASWTLKAELTGAVRLPAAEPHGSDRHPAVPARRQPAPANGAPALVDFSSGYFQRAADQLPKQGSRGRGGCTRTTSAISSPCASARSTTASCSSRAEPARRNERIPRCRRRRGSVSLPSRSTTGPTP